MELMSHLMFMDDLKLYARNEKGLDLLIRKDNAIAFSMHSIRWAQKTASTLTVFKDTRYGIYVTYFGMRLRRTSLTFDFYLTFELLTTGQHTVMKIVS